MFFRRLLKYLHIISFVALFSCNKTNFQYDNILLDEEQIYIVYRGTKTKLGNIARDFNLKDKFSSHVGFLIFKNNTWLVYHVLDENDNQSDLRIHKIKDFLDINKERVFYASLWKINTCGSKEVKAIREYIMDYEDLKIVFNRNFSTNEPNRLYCSEFIVKVLRKSDTLKYKFEKSKLKLTGVFKSYLGRDTLSYYPVDIFQDNKKFIFVKEWKLKK